MKFGRAPTTQVKSIAILFAPSPCGATGATSAMVSTDAWKYARTPRRKPHCRYDREKSCLKRASPAGGAAGRWSDAGLLPPTTKASRAALEPGDAFVGFVEISARAKS